MNERLTAAQALAGLAFGVAVVVAIATWPWVDADERGSAEQGSTERQHSAAGSTGRDDGAAEAQDARDKEQRYRELASRIGVEYDRYYRYRRWAELKRENDLGVAGEYEPLACSYARESADPWQDCLTIPEDGDWEVTYYSNHDLTAMWVFVSDDDRSRVKLIKIAEGRAPELADR